jgi:pimeloyl-ACP methyl ester carboxylesterase
MTWTKRLALAFIRTKLRMTAVISKKEAAKQAFRLFCTPQTRNRDVVPPLFADAEPVSFSFAGESIHGFRINPGGRMKVLLVHGFESSVVNFEAYAAGFAAKGMEVLAFDAPAHGRSTGKQINALVYRDFLLEVMRRFGSLEAAMAHSFGGLALCLALAEQPELPPLKIALIAPATETTTAIDQFFKIAAIKDPKVKAAFLQEIRNISGHDAGWFSITRTLDSITAHSKILWIHDTDDRITPYQDTAAVREIHNPHLEFITTSGLGHRRIYRDEQVMAKVLAFIP